MSVSSRLHAERGAPRDLRNSVMEICSRLARTETSSINQVVREPGATQQQLVRLHNRCPSAIV